MGQKAPWRKEAYYHYYEFPIMHHVYPHFGLRTEQYTLVHFYGPGSSWELYDLKKDPHQIRNRYGQQGYEPITADLKTKLKAQIQKYKDGEALALFNRSQ